MPEIDQAPKQIEGKARRVQTYDPIFFWYPPLIGVGFLGLALWAAWPSWVNVILGFIAGALIAGPLAIRFRDTP